MPDYFYCYAIRAQLQKDGVLHDWPKECILVSEEAKKDMMPAILMRLSNFLSENNNVMDISDIIEEAEKEKRSSEEDKARFKELSSKIGELEKERDLLSDRLYSHGIPPWKPKLDQRIKDHLEDEI